MNRDFSELPGTLKMVMIFTDRVGFPVLAFLLMFGLCFFTLKNNTEVISQVKDTLSNINNNIERKAADETRERQQILDEVRALRRATR